MTFRASSGGWGRSPGRMGSSGSFAVTDAQIAAIFAATPGRKGWYDPSDISTLFQDTAGTTPVTSPGQGIGRISDKGGEGYHATQGTLANQSLWQTTYSTFDGVNDSWAIPAIDFTTTDKITVVSGIYKNSDATAQRIWVTTAAPATTDGTFDLLAVYGGGLPQAGIGSRGVTQRAVVPVGAASPGPYVISGIGNIGAPLAQVRSNGVSAQTVATQGGGTYGNHASSIGSVGGLNSFLNGRFYGLMIFGRLLSPDELALCERYMAQKMGITF